MRATVLAFIADVDPKCGSELERELRALRATVELPTHAPFGSLPMLHFASVVVFDTPGFPPTLVFEVNIDGGLEEFLPMLLRVAAIPIHAIFRCCADYDVRDPSDHGAMTSYFKRHAVRPNAYHIGNVGRDVQRIQREARMREEIERRIDVRLERGDRPSDHRHAYDLIRDEVARAGTFEWINEPHARQSLLQRTMAWARIAATVAALLLVLVLLLLWLRWAGLALLLLAVGGVVGTLRWHERRDIPQPAEATHPAHVRRLEEREDHSVQNHLASITIVKPGTFRRTTLRVVLWALNLVARTSTHGTLRGIPSIHFAHWSLLDGTRRLLFLSNYDGNWESYLDDFIDKSSPGVTAVWTNTVGFPRTRFLVLDGARDGVAFKAFARSQQAADAVWYSAYPNLSVQQIDSHSTLREGLAVRPSAKELPDWLRRW